ncbi:hypothetical protein BDW59DRAFT_174981 [Aspergillus cavernicola]|uniref:F-box domain-containing protein n=1 Tax=Aspergillus cavernicola TaxID=176166 RepID=A0ABR4HUD0_9EURO
MACLRDIHIKQYSCLLCRQAPTAGTNIFGAPCSRCSYSPHPLVWFHTTCYETVENSYEPSQKPTSEDLGRHAEATRPLYHSQHEERGEIESDLEGLFSEHTRRITQDTFNQDLLRQFPVEIRLMISELIAPCWSLTMLGESRRLIEQLRNLNPTREVWMLRTDYRGISYVTRLSSRPLETTATTGLVYHIKLPVTLDKIGLFVRDIQLISTGSSSANTIWSSPFPPKFHPWNFYHDRDKPRLEYLSFDTHVQDFLVCCANTRMVGIHSSSGTSTTFREFVSLMHRRMSKSYKHWIYFPLNKGHEYIKAAWIRKFKTCRRPGSSPALVPQTSLGRIITFGPRFPTRIIDYYEYHPLVKSGDSSISGLFHDGLDPAFRYISEVGVTCSDPGHSGTLELEPLPVDTRSGPPAVPPGRGSVAGTWYMTQAPLNGLAKVQVCRDQEQAHHPILFYRDQHIEWLGQMRWDRDLNQDILEPSYIETGTIDGWGYIKDIRSGAGHDSDISGRIGGLVRLPKVRTIV